MSTPSWLPTLPTGWQDWITLYKSVVPALYPRRLYTAGGDADLDNQASGEALGYVRQLYDWVLKSYHPQNDTQGLFLKRWEESLGKVATNSDVAQRILEIVAYMRLLTQTVTSDVAKGVFCKAFGSDDPSVVTLASPTLLTGWRNMPRKWVDKGTCGISARNSHAMAYNPDDDKILLFGGHDGSYKADTWEYDVATETWSQLSPVASPTARKGHQIIYRETDGCYYLFGGTSGTLLDDTQKFDGTTWTSLSPSASPSARYGHTMCYVKLGDADGIFLHGGYDGSADDQFWWYDFEGNEWIDSSGLTGAPSARNSHTMIYNPDDIKLYVRGGMSGASPVGTTIYCYDVLSGEWESGPTNTSATAAGYASAFYDTKAKQMTWFSGTATGTSAVKDFMKYNTGSDTTFQAHWPSTMAGNPGGLWVGYMVYVPTLEAGVLFGGYNGANMGNTWYYQVDHDADTWARLGYSTHIHNTTEDTAINRVLADALLRLMTPSGYEYSAGKNKHCIYGADLYGSACYEDY